MQAKVKHKNYTDGFVEFGNAVTKYNDDKLIIGKEFEKELSLAFNYLSIRQRDLEFADAMAFRLDIKIETPYNYTFELDNRKLIKLRDIIYEMKYFDISKDRRTIFFYLEMVDLNNVSDR